MFKKYTVPKDTIIDDAALIKKVVKWNDDNNKKRLDRLEKYYLGEHEILSRSTNSGTNNQLVINHAKYITDTNIGYLLGNPVDYSLSSVDGKELDINPITDAYKAQTINDLDSEIAKDVSMFGYQYEYVYSDEDAIPQSNDIDNRNIVLIRDNTMRHKKLGAIIYDPILDDKDKLTGYNLVVVDTTNVTEYTTDKSFGTLTISEASRAHGFGDVPVIEYKNNPEYQGDYEQVISLIDAYNLLESDRVNDKEQLVDAILAFINMDFTPEQANDLRTSRMIAGIPKDGDVKFITKQLNEADADVLRKAIETDIHKISMTPNMTDENFIGNSSGVAILYKLLAFEQNIKNKERYLERGLMERFKLYNTFLMLKANMQEIPIIEVDAVFKRNLPRNDYETSQTINNLKGIVDDNTLISQLSFVKDAQEVADKVEKQAIDAAAASKNDTSALAGVKDANVTTDIVVPPVAPVAPVTPPKPAPTTGA